MALFYLYRRGGATCGVQPAGPRDNMNTSSTENTSVIQAPHEATYSITQIVFIGTIGKAIICVFFCCGGRKKLERISF